MSTLTLLAHGRKKLLIGAVFMLCLVCGRLASAELIGVNPQWSGAPGMWGVSYIPASPFFRQTETMGYYIRPTQDLLVTSLGYYNGWAAFAVDWGAPDLASSPLVDDHQLGIYEIDPTFYHDEHTPGNGTLLAQTVLRVGEGTLVNSIQYKEIEPTLLKADHIYAIVGFGSSRFNSSVQSALEYGDPVVWYGYLPYIQDWQLNDPGLRQVVFGPGFEFLGHGYSYLQTMAEPLWYDLRSEGLAYGALPYSLYLGPGFQYQLVGNNTVETPEPASVLYWLASCILTGGWAYRRRRAGKHGTDDSRGSSGSTAAQCIGSGGTIR